MKILPSALSERHIGMLCVVRFSISGTGFVGHSQRHGFERGSTPTLYILVGRLDCVTDEEITFTDFHYSKHRFDLSMCLGPRYESNNGPYRVQRKNLYEKTPIVLNHLPSSSAVMQHLMRANKSKFWNCERRLVEKLKAI